MVDHNPGKPCCSRPILEESIAVWRKVGVKEGHAEALNQLGTVAHGQNVEGEALTLYQESLDMFREIRSNSNIEMVLFNLACIVQGQGGNNKAEQP
jgi:hypothetical protein